MEKPSDHPSEPLDDDANMFPSVEEVVERLERWWTSSPPAYSLDGNLQGLNFGHYKLRQLQGQGSFGVVYLAHDTQLDRDVAIKIPAQVLADDEKRRRFEAEAAMAAMLDHPGIVTVYEADLAGPTPYIASAYCPGPDLGQFLSAEHAAVSWSEAATFVAALADAIDYAHQKGVYHRDLKPSNILLVPLGDRPHFVREAARTTARRSNAEVDDSPQLGEMGTVPLVSPLGRLSDFQPKITDFGLAKQAQMTAAETRSSLLLGTPLYMVPEQLESQHNAPSAAADVYSLGCLLYELVAGRPPIEGDSYVQMLDRLRESPPAPLRKRNPEVPKDLERLTAKCLEKNPLARYQTAGELAADLRACVAGEPIDASGVGMFSRLAYWCTRPQRIRDAGWYTLCVQLLFVVWLMIVSTGAYFVVEMPLAALGHILADTGIFLLAVHLPMAIVGWFTTRSRGWAIYTGFYLTLANLLAPVIFYLLQTPPLYADIYSRIQMSQYTKFVICSLMLLAELGQFVLYAVAIVAWRRMPQNRRG